MKPNGTQRPAAEAPAPFQKLAAALKDSGIPDPMSPWQLAGFAAGLICGLGPEPADAFDPEEDPDEILVLDCIDEMSRRIEDNDSPLPAEDVFDGPRGHALRDQLVAAVAGLENQLLESGGHPVLACSDPAATAQNPALADIPAARAYARGLLRGLVMSMEDEDELAGEVYGEPLSLLFILTEDDLGDEFGSAAEAAEARAAVAMALPGLVSQLWTISHEEE